MGIFDRLPAAPPPVLRNASSVRCDTSPLWRFRKARRLSRYASISVCVIVGPERHEIIDLSLRAENSPYPRDTGPSRTRTSPQKPGLLVLRRCISLVEGRYSKSAGL